MRKLQLLGICIIAGIILVACSPNEPDGNNSGNEKPTELWVMGITKQPELATPIKAMGVRGFANLRETKGDIATEMFSKCNELGIGLAITLRWVDPQQENKDKAPTESEGDSVLNLLLPVLDSPQAKALGSKLWIGFYSEIASGGGTVPYEESDKVLDWAAKAADQIRARVPGVHIVGPGLLIVNVLARDRSTLNDLEREQYDYLDKILRWDIEHNAAIDLHLHVESPEEAAQRIKIVKGYLQAKIPGSQNAIFVAQEWSPAFYPNRDDLHGVEDAINGIYCVMNENNFEWAGYGAYYTFEGQPEVYNWKNLVNNSDKSPHEPFYSIFINLAEKVRANELYRTCKDYYLKIN